MTSEQRNNLIGAVLIGVAILQLIPVLPIAINIIKTIIQQDFQEQQK